MTYQRVIAIKTQIFSIPFSASQLLPAYRGIGWAGVEILYVRVEMSDGAIGWGEASVRARSDAVRAAIDTIVAPLVIGKTLADLSRLRRLVLSEIYRLGCIGPCEQAFAGVEMALWDLAAKAVGCPLAQLFGGDVTRDVAAYASMPPYGDAAVIRRNVEAAIAKRLQARQDSRRRPACVAGRDGRSGRDARVIVDAGCSWSLPEAERKIRTIGHLKLAWLEEPVWPPGNVCGLATIRGESLPVAAGRLASSIAGMKQLLDARAFDIALVDLSQLGGVGEATRVVALCEASGVDVVFEAGHVGPAFAAAAHIAAAGVERPVIEVLWPELEVNPFTPLAGKRKTGKIQLLGAPGLGCDPQLDVLEPCRRGASVKTT